MENERARFVLEAEVSELSHSELCRKYNISRPTGYKWIRRFQEEDLKGLKNRSHRTHSCPHATSSPVVQRVLEIRTRRSWGARKIRTKLEQDSEIAVAPSIDTIQRILSRHGCITPRKPRRQRNHSGPPIPIPPQPNATWTADFKGEFRMKDGNLCFPLTILDGYSRFLLACKGMLNLDLHATMRRFDRLFREFGLPDRIRTDNGHPFASRAIAGLSQLSVWWISLGILPDLIEPGKPQQNGRHERMHRTLKEDAATPPHRNLRAQQRSFNRFREVYNFERPHEALQMETPSAVYRASDRLLTTPEPPVYPAHYERRRVAGDATIRWKKRKVFVSTLLKQHHVGLEQLSDGVWSVYYGPVHLGWLDELDYRIMDVKERARRRR